MPSNVIKLKEPKELKPGRLRWLYRAIYEDIGSLHIDLNPTERRMVVEQLATSLVRHETLTLALRSVREALYKIYNDMVRSGMTTSQLSSKFNMSVRRHNDQIRDLVDASFKLAHDKELAGEPSEAALQLHAAGLSHKILFSPEITSLVELNQGEAATELVRIDQYRELLFNSTLKMVVGIANKKHALLDGNTVEWADLIQEGMIAAMAAVEAYQPLAEGNTFTSYMHTYVSGIISKKVNETTRTVFIPRSTLDRFVYVNKAIDELGMVISDLRGGRWQDGKLTEGKVDDNTLQRIADQATLLQKGNNFFTAEEVQELIIFTQDEISMDLEVASPDGTESISFGEEIPSEDPPADEVVDGALVGRRLMELVRQYTTTEEYLIMELRWGMGAVKGYKTVAEEYTDGTGKPMNKGKAAHLEKQVLSRLQTETSTDPTLMKQFREIMATLVFLPKS